MPITKSRSLMKRRMPLCRTMTKIKRHKKMRILRKASGMKRMRNCWFHYTKSTEVHGLFSKSICRTSPMEAYVKKWCVWSVTGKSKRFFSAGVNRCTTIEAKTNLKRMIRIINPAKMMKNVKMNNQMKNKSKNRLNTSQKPNHLTKKRIMYNSCSLKKARLYGQD